MQRGEWGHSFEGRKESTAFLRAQPLFGPVTFFICGPGSPPLSRYVTTGIVLIFKQGIKVKMSLPLHIGHHLLKCAGWEETVEVTPFPSSRPKEMRL